MKEQFLISDRKIKAKWVVWRNDWLITSRSTEYRLFFLEKLHSEAKETRGSNLWGVKVGRGS